ncbi:MAG: NAD+ synthase [Syntrophomonadaceae bacterium]|nr:NAD+ synthase [Syntrophomonadaceae bacterium]
MRVTLAQINPTIGDIEGNLLKINNVLETSTRVNSDLVVFPELSLVGYPPRDLLERSWFIAKSKQAIDKLANISTYYPNTGILVGAPTANDEIGKGLYNSALLIYRGKIIISQSKSLLPTYDVFDEARYFDSAKETQVIHFKDRILGISICEDAWNDPNFWPKRIMYLRNPIEQLYNMGATMFINISASPFHIGKEQDRYRLIQNHTLKYRIPFIYVNQVGGNDELVFDGRSLFLDRDGEPVLICPGFKEHVQTVDTNMSGKAGSYVFAQTVETVYEALVLGIRDYMAKCGFSRAVIGLSGGIDSALTCCLACAAIGAKNVLGISMPSFYSSPGSISDSRKLAENLGIEFKVIPISGIQDAYLETLDKHMASTGPDVMEENIQARIRGNILMAFSNKYGYLVLSTGNKSELSVGYCTLYGDMSGGLNVLSDVPKTMVYEIAKYINRKSEIIPWEIIQKPPSAELRPGQLDQDTLPPYDILDKIIYYYIEEGLSLPELIELGFDSATVKWVIQAIDKSEYKRRQAPPGLKITYKSFGVGRRMQIAAKIPHEQLMSQGSSLTHK